jgi:hypothetical protein
MLVGATRRATLAAPTSAAGAGAGSAAAAASASTTRSYLSMYSEQPNEEVTLEDFEVLAFERLKGKMVAQRNHFN